MIGETGERKSAVATPDGKSRKKKKKKKKRRVYVDQSEESRGLVGSSSARGSRFDQSEEGIC